MKPAADDRFEMKALFKGNVQGVGFRATTCSIANELHVTGTARNLEDGDVEVIAQGTQEQLLNLISRLKAFYGNDYIEKVVHEFHAITHPHDRFTIAR